LYNQLAAIVLSVNTDRFLCTTSNVIKDPPRESNSGDTSVNSGGFSHHSR